jgi:hypothetical protein
MGCAFITVTFLPGATQKTTITSILNKAGISTEGQIHEWINGM